MEQDAQVAMLTPGQVSAYLGVDPKTASRWAVTGHIKSIRTPGGHRRYRQSDVLSILEGLTPNSGTQPVLSESVLVLQDDAALLDGSDHAARAESAAAAVVAEAVAIAMEAEAAEAAEALELVAAAVAAAADKAVAAAARAQGA